MFWVMDREGRGKNKIFVVLYRNWAYVRKIGY